MKFNPPPANANGGYTIIWLNFNFIFIVFHLPKTLEKSRRRAGGHDLCGRCSLWKCQLQGIPSIAGSDLSSAPVTLMPFGKRVFTSAVEGEFKQSCVIFAFYFMSFAATIPDGCRSFVAFFIMCIIWIVFMGFYLARSLCTWLLLSSHFFMKSAILLQKY